MSALVSGFGAATGRVGGRVVGAGAVLVLGTDCVW